MGGITHGMSSHPLYKRWQDIIQRCYNPTCSVFGNYGAKGVTVCSQWRDDPVAFIDWALAEGWQPGMEIDKDIKIPGSKTYSPVTCSIVTPAANRIERSARATGRSGPKLKLSVATVAEIVRRKNDGELTRDLAQEFDVNIRTINRVYDQHR